MGFLKDLFKKEEYNPDKFAIPTKTKQIPEYHKCPVCGHENKTKQRDWSKYTQMYLDGQYKIAIQDYVDEYYYCPECGFVYSNGEIEDGFPEGYFTGKIKNTVFSQAYQDIRCSNLEETYKKILLMDLISKCDMKIFLNINQIWLNYYESIGNEKKKQYYLQKRIKETPDGYSYNADVRYGESVIQFPDILDKKTVKPQFQKSTIGKANGRRGHGRGCV